jgi:uncharacterized protein (TIGR02145 family)
MERLCGLLKINSMNSKSLLLNILFFWSGILFAQNSDYKSITWLDKEIIYSDDFYSDKGLRASNDGISFGQYYYKYYELRSSSSSNFGELSLNKTIDQTKDFQIEATMKFVSGEDNNGNGIIWGKSNDSWDNFYNFKFTGNGYFGVGKRNLGTYTSIKEWTLHSSINKTDYNKLTIRKVGNNNYFFINESLVYQCEFESFYGDKNCLFSNSNSTINISKIEFSYLKTQNKQANGDVIYFDDFSTDNGLEVYELSSIGKYNYRYYALSSTSSSNIGTLSLNKTIDQTKDFQIEATMKFVSGGDNGGNGIIWGKSNYSWDNFYSFTFSGKGSYSIGKKVNGVWDNSIVPWTATSYLKKSDYNKLTIRKAGNQCYFFINENLVHQCLFESFYGDENCLFSNSNSTINISNIALTYFNGNTKKNDVENLASTATTYSPTYTSSAAKVSLDKIEINQKYTVVTMTYKPNFDNAQFWFNKNAYIKANQKYYYLVKSDIGFSQYDCNFLKNKDQSKTFKLYFNRLEEGIENIDIWEDESQEAFNFQGVKINNPYKSSNTNSSNANNNETKNLPLKLSQTWTKENARIATDIDGIDLILAEDIDQWKSLCDKDQAAYCYYKFDSDNEKMGFIYNHAAVRIIAPEGYRVPSKKDFELLLTDLKSSKRTSSLCRIVKTENCSICFNCKSDDYDGLTDFKLKPFGWLCITKSNNEIWKENKEDMYLWTLEKSRNSSMLSGLGLAQFKMPSTIRTIELKEINNVGSKSENVDRDNYEFIEKYYGTFLRFVKN